jgi:hypothetical protein
MENENKEQTKELQVHTPTDVVPTDPIENQISELEDKNTFAVMDMSIPIIKETVGQINDVYATCMEKYNFYINDCINTTNFEDSSMQTDPTQTAAKYMELALGALKLKTDITKQMNANIIKRKSEKSSPKAKPQNIVTNNSVVFSETISRRKKLEIARQLTNINVEEESKTIDSEVIEDGK